MKPAKENKAKLGKKTILEAIRGKGTYMDSIKPKLQAYKTGTNRKADKILKETYELVSNYEMQMPRRIKIEEGILGLEGLL